MDDRIYDEPSDVAAQDGVVVVDGPDAVAVLLTPAAAEETGQRLIDGAVTAQGQRLLKQWTEKAPAPRGSDDEP